MPPRKYIDYDDLAESRVTLDELNSLTAPKSKWWQRDPLAKREKADYRKFFDVVNKHIVFYSESSGFYRYFQGAIEWLLENSDVNIHYVTNDPNDQIFEISKRQPRICPYFIGEKKAITLMMKMDADVVAMTLEDLENYYIKRSYIRKDVEYVFLCHHMTSMHLVSRKEAFDHYDTILCAGPHQIKEIRRAEEIYKLPEKRLISCGYDLLDRSIDNHKSLADAKNDRPTILIGPSWQESNILDLCFDDIIKPLLGHGYRIIVRPHPEYTKRYRPRWELLQERYKDISDEELFFERDFSSNESVFSSDVLMTDWSTLSAEFSFSTLKPCIFINTPMKVENPHWTELDIEPTDITLRDQIGVSLDPDNLSNIDSVVSEMLKNEQAWHDKIEGIRSQFIFNVGNGGKTAGEYLLERILTAQEHRSEANDNDLQ